MSHCRVLETALAALAKLLVATFIITLSGAMMPGPLLTVAISETVRRGRWQAMLLLVGHALIELALIVAFILGIRDLIKTNAVIQTIGLFGGGFLLWMGYSILRGVVRKEISLDLHDHGGKLRFGAVGQGVVVSVSNPYWTLWWVTIGAKLIADALAVGTAGLVVFYFAHELSDFTWYGVVTFAVAGGRRFISDSVYRGMLGACGAFLVVLAVSYLVPSVSFLGGLLR